MYLCLFFGGLFLYLGFWGLDLETWSKKLSEKRKRETDKKKETVHCLQGANPALPQGEGPPRGNSREFFFSPFWRLFQIFKKQTFMSGTLQLFF